MGDVCEERWSLPTRLHVVSSEDHNTNSVISLPFVPCTFQCSIKIDLKETGCEVTDWIHWLSTGPRLARSYEHGIAPSSC